MSAIWMRPPGRSTRCTSLITAALSGQRLITPLLITTSTEPPSTGSCSAKPCRTSTLSRPSAAPPARVFSIIASVMSTATTLPPGPTRRAASSVSKPAPQPMSSTLAPSLSRPIENGLPVPANESTVSGGSQSTSAWS